MSLGMRMIVGEELTVCRRELIDWHHSIYQLSTIDYQLFQGTARNVCRIRSSGYCGKKTSAIKKLFGVSSRVAIISLYSLRFWGLMRIVPGFSALAWLSDYCAQIGPADSSS